MTPELKQAFDSLAGNLEIYRKSGQWVGGQNDMNKLQSLSILLGFGAIQVTCANCIRSRLNKIMIWMERNKEVI